MTSPRLKIKRVDSLEDFEFFDVDEDLNVNFPKSPIQNAVGKLGAGVAMIFSALCTITEEEGLVVTVPVRAVATTAATTLSGTLIGGVPGMAIGLIAGAVISYRNSPNRSNKSSSPKSAEKKCSLRQIISEMTIQQKTDLLRELLGCLKQSNVRHLVTEICKNEEVRKIAIKILSDYLFKRMGINLVRPK